MADGTIRIDIDVDGQSVDTASDSLDNLEKSGEKSSSSMKDLAKSLGLVAVGAAAFNELRKSVGQAVKRFDTLQKFPKVLQSLGVSAEDSERAMSTLSDGIDGLPTTLDDIASTAQRMYTSFGDMDKAADSALALNNALLGGGASADQARRGTEMYLKSLQTGEIDLQTWRSLSETMDIGLVKVAESFGYAGASAKDDLYQALKDGSITMDEFNDKLIDLGTGTGELAQLAKENSLGIATSFANLRNAAAVGIANIIESFDKLSQEVTGKTIAEHLDSLKGVVNASFGAMQKAIEMVTPAIKVLAMVLKPLFAIVKKISPVLIGAAAGLAAMATASAGLKVAAAGVKLFRTALVAMSGPVGWTVAGIGALAGAVVGIVKWFKRDSEETKRLKEETSELSEATSELTDEVESNAKAYEKGISDIEGTAKANEDLMNKVADLADKENKSAGEKEMLAQYTDQLNESVEGLNLAYDEEADMLNMSSDNMKARLKLFEEQEKANAGMERTKEITQELTQVEKELEEVNRLRIENNGESKEVSQDLNEQEQLLMDTYRALRGEYVEVEEQVEESMAAVEEHTKKASEGQQLVYSELKDHHKTIIDDMRDKWDDLAETSTSVFDRISDEAEVSFEEMKEIQQHNLEATADWAKNLEQLADDGVSSAFLDTFRERGPESAAEVEQLANANIDEVIKMGEEYEAQTNRALDQMAQAYNLDTKQVEAVRHLVERTGMSLDEAIQAAGFDDYGGNIPEGVAQGVEDGAGKVATAVSNLADVASKEFKRSAKIQSPSRVFISHGENISEGTAIGIENGESNILAKIQSVFNGMMNRTKTGFKGVADDSEEGVNQVGVKMLLLSIVSKRAMDSMIKKVKAGGKSQIQYMKSLSANMYNAFSRMPSQMSSIGINAMSGLNSGLWGGKARVMATARNIANSVASTMRNALRIHSPSRVMRDDVGFEIPAGVAEGIEGNASSVYKALDSLSNKMRVSTPEVALGTHQMAYTNNRTPSPTHATTQPSNNQSGLIGVLREQTNILVQIAKKDPDLYVDGEKLTDIVNENNAVVASLNKF